MGNHISVYNHLFDSAQQASIWDGRFLNPEKFPNGLQLSFPILRSIVWERRVANEGGQRNRLLKKMNSFFPYFISVGFCCSIAFPMQQQTE